MIRPTQALQMRPTQRLFSSSSNSSPGKVRTWLKSLPVEVYPLAGIIGFMVSFATYSMVRGFRDRTLRLSRQRPEY
ncbi:hypothetical protein B0O99DRAFT_692702 [Bisporella sp. PMI_857]|nr:hypothetical protein B0O99DRAFT_692702 [Bisporella sp. PMI_857]